jgi:hypothetical protein
VRWDTKFNSLVIYKEVQDDAVVINLAISAGRAGAAEPNRKMPQNVA